MTQKWRRDVVEAVGRSSASAAEIKGTLRGDARTSVWRSGCDKEKHLKIPLHVPMQRQLIERETKSNGRRGRPWNEVERENESGGRPNGRRGEIWRTMRSERDRADEIERQKRAGEIKRMKSQT
jgi:hypothetical protein